jgi:hypothetical protein
LYYDDNFGCYEIRDQEDVDFYHYMQTQSVEKICRGCGAHVRLKADYAFCNGCADRIEQGREMPDYYWDGPDEEE